MKHNAIIFPCLAAVFLYLVGSIVWAVLAGWFPLSGAGTLASAAGEESARVRISLARRGNMRLPGWWAGMVDRLHGQNGAVLYALAQYAGGAGRLRDARGYLARAMDADPKNLPYYAAYVRIVRDMGQPLAYTDEVAMLARGFLSADLYGKFLRNLNGYPPDVAHAVQGRTLDIDAMAADTVTEVLARSFYLYGVSLRDSNPTGTLHWWTLAWHTDPGVSYYAISVASLQKWMLSDEGGAQKILHDCLQNPFARLGCQRALDNLPYPPVNYFDRIIIPGIPFAAP